MGDNDTVHFAYDNLDWVVVRNIFWRWIMHTIWNKVLIEVSFFFRLWLLLSVRDDINIFQRQTAFCISYHQRPPFQSDWRFRVFFCLLFFQNSIGGECVCRSFVLHNKILSRCRPTIRLTEWPIAHIKSEWENYHFSKSNSKYDISSTVRWTWWDLLPHKL